MKYVIVLIIIGLFAVMYSAYAAEFKFGGKITKSYGGYLNITGKDNENIKVLTNGVIMGICKKGSYILGWGIKKSKYISAVFGYCRFKK